MKPYRFFGAFMAWTFILIALIFSLGCGPSRSYETITPEEYCPVVEVENGNWADVVVYMTNPRQRLGFVTGHTTKDIVACDLDGRPSEFEIRAIGGAFRLPLRGAIGYVSPGTYIKIYVGPTPNLSFIVG
jgi:hypothetical protein